MAELDENGDGEIDFAEPLGDSRLRNLKETA